jgi:hypothetical protein
MPTQYRAWLPGTTARRRVRSLPNIRGKSDPPADRPRQKFYAPGCSIFGTATLSYCRFGAPLAHRQIAVADNEAPVNAAKGIADPTCHYKWLSAQNSSLASTSC